MIPLGALADQVGERVILLPSLFHIMWRQELLADPGSACLSFSTAVTLAGGER